MHIHFTSSPMCQHEFISMFRRSYLYAALHPSDIHVLETIDEECIRYGGERDRVHEQGRNIKWLNRGVPRPRPGRIVQNRASDRGIQALVLQNEE
ncbi:hypothetical protein FIBSPDRAFT_879758 [Athelia psychrophila]|uniref:Uncharacterized protein n=1 Tax=Athelia psychrophila TaxID=1759441 RepID=A0A167TLV0_9AGAM|nr:hypothetical protein FIBSPDRAFT_879758 [Fibularhizoctonia sp. CBS 109695]